MNRNRSPPLNITIKNFPHVFFDSNVICGLSFKVPFSRYYVKTKQILNNYANNNTIEGKYVLCPIYAKKQGDKFVPTDIQIGVTGKVKQSEPVKMGVNREIGEELGIIVSYDEINNSIISDKNNPSLFLINAKNAISATVESEEYIKEWQMENDDPDRKIGICIIGSKEEVTKLLSYENIGYRYLNHENDIIGIIAIPINTALKQLGKI